MSSDRTPADVIARARFEAGHHTQWEHLSPEMQAVLIDAVQPDLDALAAAGFRVTPEPDDTTRALAARLRADAVRYEDTAQKMGPLGWGWQRQADDLRDAAALLDGQPQDRPATCPTCGSSDPAVDNLLRYTDRAVPCSNRAWHVGGSGD